MQAFYIAVISLAVSLPACAVVIAGKIVGVSDGDTITVLDASHTKHRIRLSGIDAPERGQAFGEMSKQHLSAMVFGKLVEVDTYKTDQYGREVGKILLNGVDVNVLQIRAGLAWHYKQYADEQPRGERGAYAMEEVRARSAGVGLWGEPQPVEPWVWRRMVLMPTPVVSPNQLPPKAPKIPQARTTAHPHEN